MIGPVIRDLRDRDIIISLRKASIMAVDIGDQLRVIRITPELRRMLPGNRSLYLHAVRQLVEHDSLKVLVVFQNEPDVMQVIHQHTVLVIFQTRKPLIPIVGIIKIFPRLRHAFLRRKRLYLRQTHYEIRHLFERLLRLFIRELMDPHKVKSVYQLPERRIRRMMRISKSAILI